jgi:hypothetical protein
MNRLFGEEGIKMAQFLGEVSGSRGKASRLGTKKGGLATTAASWSGCVKVYLFHDEKTGADMFQVTQQKWKNAGTHEVIAEGIVGQPTKKDDGKAELVETLRAALDYLDADEGASARELRKHIAETLKKAEG